MRFENIQIKQLGPNDVLLIATDNLGHFWILDYPQETQWVTLPHDTESVDAGRIGDDVIVAITTVSGEIRTALMRSGDVSMSFRSLF